jgi:hypothetical protein
MDPEYRRDARENVHIKGERAVLTRLLAPVMIRGSGRISEDQEALLFGQSPQIRESEEGPQSRSAKPPSVGRRKTRNVEARRSLFYLGWSRFASA